ncbi:MAG: low molecular weight protein arginine phosphatase [Thermodesulfobacteriota bacterium]|nr:low molecular weight protein arginine phosphatase [Thermodesulfobacteriota bacterium]
MIMPGRVDLAQVSPIIKSVLFVCTGNICRSPMAEAILKKMVPAEADIHVFSAGSHAREGNLATENSISVSREAGIDLRSHRARKLTTDMAGEADMILAMEPLHIEHVLSLDIWMKDKTFNLIRFAQDHQGGGDLIPDPYGGSPMEYQICFRRIDECVNNFYEMIRGRLIQRNR